MAAEEKFLEMMIDAIRIIASDFEVQVKAFPDFVFVPDEVVSTFDETFLLFDQVIDANLVDFAQIRAVNEINDYFEKMNNKKVEDNQWTLEAMQTSPDWQHLRLLAKNALALFGSSDNKPNLGWVTYVKNKKPPKE